MLLLAAMNASHMKVLSIVRQKRELGRKSVIPFVNNVTVNWWPFIDSLCDFQWYDSKNNSYSHANCLRICLRL